MISLKSILFELEYPLAGKEDLHSYGGMEGWKGKIVWMTPDKFLSLCHPLPRGEENDESAQNLEYRMRNGLPLDFLVLKIDSKIKKVIGHEGRHRATVAKKLGITKVPVLVYFEEAYPRVPKWTDKEHEFADKAEFDPEWKKLQEGKLDLDTKGDISPEEKERAGKLLYQFFKERDTLKWLFTYKWTLERVNTSHVYVDGERYSFTYMPRKGRDVQRPGYPGADYTELRKGYRTPKDAVEYAVASEKAQFGDRFVFRGMNMAEWIQAKKQGFVQSNFKYNLGGVQYTYYGKEWSTAHSYAGGFAPFDKEPTRDLPGVIIAVPRELTQNARDVTGQNTDNEYVAESIPIDQVKGVWFIVPTESGDGSLEIVLKNGRLDRGSASPPITRHVIVPKQGIAL